MDFKRDLIKYCRDKAKSDYKKEEDCFICGSTDELQFHHFYSMTPLLEKFLKKTKVEITCEDDILVYRDQFISAHHTEIYEKTVTLCKSCHMGELHRIYGKSPSLATAGKQERWAQRQRDKRLGVL